MSMCPRCGERPATTNYGRWCPECRAEVEGIADELAADVAASVFIRGTLERKWRKARQNDDLDVRADGHYRSDWPR